ncbi:MAG: hypothetical protein M3115_00240, partial [Thermoproteota archaeon]|nr:hypothetical protein [Thermoproteota archaeon]
CFYCQVVTEFHPRRKDGYVVKHINMMTCHLQHPAGYENSIKRLYIFMRQVSRMKNARDLAQVIRWR